MIEVLDGGISTTVQDLGRHGQYHIGMPPSGAMDEEAHRVANALVGNEADDATLEMTYGGADLRFETDAVVALSGATMAATIGDEPVPMHTAVRVEEGEELETEFATDGARTYLSVAGGIDVDPVMESRSTYTLVGIGGYEGRTLAEGDRLPIGEQSVASDEVIGAEAPDEHLRDLDGDGTDIAVVVGLCDYRLTDESRERLCDTEWTVTPEADRVGYRLEGPELEFVEREQPFGAGRDPSNVVDIGYPVGSIQLPQKPIVLMQDAVTGGGYATVGTVVSTERNRLAQRRTHETVQFEAVTVDEAVERRGVAKDRMAALREALEG